MARSFAQAYNNAKSVQDKNTAADIAPEHKAGDDTAEVGVRSWKDITIYIEDENGRHERVTSLQERAAVFSHLQDTGEWLKGYTPFSRPVVAELSLNAFDVLLGVDETGAPIDLKNASDDVTAEYIKAQEDMTAFVASRANTYSLSNLPIYERFGEKSYRRNSEHTINTAVYWTFKRFHRFPRPGDTGQGSNGYSPWPYDVNYQGCKSAASEGSSKADTAIKNLIKNVQRPTAKPTAKPVK